jgi:hypothetical protein
MSAGARGGWLRTHARPIVVAVLAGGGYGGWAAYAHHHLGVRVALFAGATQVLLSVTATLVLVLLLERLFRWPANPVRGFWLASCGTSTLSVAWLVTGHAVAGTPHIALAIAPSVGIGTISYVGYARALLAHKRFHRERAAAAPAASDLANPLRSRRLAAKTSGMAPASSMSPP